MSDKYNLDDSPPCDISEFKSAMGMLVQHVDYRLDIAFPVSKIGHSAANPGKRYGCICYISFIICMVLEIWG